MKTKIQNKIEEIKTTQTNYDYTDLELKIKGLEEQLYETIKLLNNKKAIFESYQKDMAKLENALGVIKEIEKENVV